MTSLKYKMVLMVTPLVFLLDQLSKWWVAGHVQLGQRIPIVAGWIDLVHFRNTGAAFGMFAHLRGTYHSLFFYAVAVVAVIILIGFLRSLTNEERLQPLALAFIFGGIAGNITDRVRLGEVIDFLSCHVGDRHVDWSLFGQRIAFALEWPAFNVADSAITIAMILLAWSMVRK